MPIKYVPFLPEPMEGQAVLGNFHRILKYRGADDVSMVLERGMPLYELEKQEAVGENRDGNLIIRGECISACAYLKEQGVQVDLVYIDPPFASGADYAKTVYLRRNPRAAQAAALETHTLEFDELRVFEEKMYGDVWDKEKYLNWMYENLAAIKSVMSETATIFVHLDYNISHYVKILLDEVFGERHFLNHIVWCYQTRQFSKRYFNRKHHDIFWYANDPEKYVFNWDAPGVLQEYSESTIKKYKLQDEKGFYRLCGRGIEGSPIKGAKDVDPQWEIDHPEWVVRDYLGEGFAPSDYWMIDIVNQSSSERTDYATQKPEALLEKIIKAASREHMLVADFFGGSGVAAAAAHRLGRRFLHCDVGLNSIQVARDRLKADGAEFDVLEIKDGVSLYRNPVQTMDKIKSLIPGLREEPSLGSFWAGAVTDSKRGTVPVYVPNLLDHSSRLLDVVMINRIIHQEIPDLDGQIQRVIVYYIDLTDEEELRKFIARDESTAVEIELRDLKAVLDGVVIGDYASFHVEETEGGYAVVVDAFASDRVGQKLAEFNEKARLNATLKRPFRPVEVSEGGLELIEALSLDCTAGQGAWHSESEISIDKNGYVSYNGKKTKYFWDGTICAQRRPVRLKIRNLCGDETIWPIPNP